MRVILSLAMKRDLPERLQKPQTKVTVYRYQKKKLTIVSHTFLCSKMMEEIAIWGQKISTKASPSPN